VTFPFVFEVRARSHVIYKGADPVDARSIFRSEFDGFHLRSVSLALKGRSEIVNHQLTVSFGLPPPLSFQDEDRAMVVRRSGQTSTGRASGSGCQAA
jgi:hypothetical protein